MHWGFQALRKGRLSMSYRLFPIDVAWPQLSYLHDENVFKLLNYQFPPQSSTRLRNTPNCSYYTVKPVKSYSMYVTDKILVRLGTSATKVMGKQWTGTVQREKSHPQNQNGKQPKSQIDKIQWGQMANRVGSYFLKGGHSATQTELKV